MKQLPLGRQSFEDLRNSNCLYIDKTEIIHRIISGGKMYFLSRPRRFGKSLLLSTIEAIFEGKKNLFEGLYIYDRWDWSQSYPVISIDWTQINHSTLEKMEENMMDFLRRIANSHQITLTSRSASGCFSELIESLHDKNGGKQVVILIDEYDMPVTGHLFDSQLTDIRKAVHDFYQVMKGADKYIRFIFVTGVSKFSGLSIFSALNNLTDITLNVKYAAVCGYTQEELESNFSEYINSAAAYLNMTGEELLSGIRYWYNGYTWDGKTAIYNPFSTLNFFDTQRFANYWFRTGTPTFLIEIIQRRNRTNVILEPIVVSENALDGYDPPDTGEVPLLFQTGYLTVKQMDLIDGRAVYTLGIPNSEVNEGFLTCLLKAYGKYPDYGVDQLRRTMIRQINDCDEAGFARSLEAMTATVPYEIHRTNEAWYHSMMLIWMRLIGFRIHGEESNNRGRADAVWEQPGATVVAEIKYHAEKTVDTLLDEAMSQIHDRRYYNRYPGRIILMGIAFSGKNTGCRMEELRTDNTVNIEN
jgi:hypothetical protein